jgi:hypothetical protein
MDKLKAYRQKRDFEKTSEPDGSVPVAASVTSPVVVSLDGAVSPAARPQQRCSSRDDGGGH